MKVLEIISNLANGGAEKLIVELANLLSENNDVTLASFNKTEDWMFFPKKIQENVKFVTLNKKPGFSFKLFWVLFTLIKRTNPDVIHIHLHSTLRYFLFLIPLFSKIKFVYTIHNTFEPFKKSFERYSKLWFFRRISFVCLSNSIYRKFSNHFPKLQFFTVENGLGKLSKSTNFEALTHDFENYRTSDKTIIFLFVGRLSSQKNIPLLLNLFENLKDKNIKLLIIGKDGTEGKENENLINTYSHKNIIYLGPKENVTDYMYQSDALILTSKHEGMPIVVLEALSIGLPIISTPVGGMVDIVKNGVNGFLSDDLEKQSMIKVVDKFIELDEKEIRQIRNNNIELFRDNYSIEICSQKYITVFNKNYLLKNVN